jgi:hypothetical protein
MDRFLIGRVDGLDWITSSKSQVPIYTITYRNMQGFQVCAVMSLAAPGWLATLGRGSTRKPQVMWLGWVLWWANVQTRYVACPRPATAAKKLPPLREQTSLPPEWAGRHAGIVKWDGEILNV